MGRSACLAHLLADKWPAELSLHLAASKAKYPHLETTGLAHTQDIKTTTTQVKAITKALMCRTSMAKAMVTTAPAGDTVPDTQTAVPGVRLAKAMATTAFSQLVTASVVKASVASEDNRDSANLLYLEDVFLGPVAREPARKANFDVSDALMTIVQRP